PKHDVSDRLKTRLFPRVEEHIDLRPAVEANHHAILLKDSICFPHRRLEPVGLRVVLNGASIAVAIVHEIGWVGEGEIDAVSRHLPHDLDAVAVKDRVDWKPGWY